jgi:hypothetical protein
MKRLRLGMLAVLVITAPQAHGQGVTPKACPQGMQTIADCPVSGCGDVADAFLNEAKNRTDNPAAADVQDISVAEMTSLAQPSSWKTGKSRTTIEGQGKEGTAVRLVGFLKIVKKEGGETCNCELHSPTLTDVHLAIVKKKSDAETKSVTAELTPRVRAAGHENWVFDNVKPLEGKLVRLTGWLMLDTAHLKRSSSLPGEHPMSSLKRATNWEVHPVMRLEVCGATVTECKAGTGWQDF